MYPLLFILPLFLPGMSLSTYLLYASLCILVGMGITWIQLRTEIQKLVQQTPTDFSFQGLLEELPHLTIQWEGKTLLNGPAVHEMCKTFLGAYKSPTFQIQIQNTHPNPKIITVPSGTYQRFSEKRGIGWDPVPTPAAEVAPTYFT
jgi:hypothetical protein